MPQPYILEETADFSVVFKPPRMHSAKIAKSKEQETRALVEWYSENSSVSDSLPDGGLMHRLDYETCGLVLFAKNQKSYDFFRFLQDKGEFIKEYSAACSIPQVRPLCGFPPPPSLSEHKPSEEKPLIIMSYFRPFGPGRKQVRPVIDDAQPNSKKKHREVSKDKGGFYRTEIISILSNGNGAVYTVRIKRGFRHQIRCHLYWIGSPILNDPVYSPPMNESNCVTAEPLALRANALFFSDPSSGKQREFRIDAV